MEDTSGTGADAVAEEESELVLLAEGDANTLGGLQSKTEPHSQSIVAGPEPEGDSKAKTVSVKGLETGLLSIAAKGEDDILHPVSTEKSTARASDGVNAKESGERVLPDTTPKSDVDETPASLSANKRKHEVTPEISGFNEKVGESSPRKVARVRAPGDVHAESPMKDSVLPAPGQAVTGNTVKTPSAPAADGPKSTVPPLGLAESVPATPHTKPTDSSAVTPSKTPQDTGVANEESESDGEGEFDLSGTRKHEYEQVARFGPEQLQRYEQYRRSDLKKEKIKKVLTAINPILAKSSDPFLIAVKGLAKVFVGDVVETALEFRDQCGETGPLQPKHMREAYRRIRSNGGLPSTSRRPRGLG